MEFKDFDEIWAIDFEFSSPPGEIPLVHCLVAMELHSGRVLELWADQLQKEPPFHCGRKALVVAYSAQAELKCFKSLQWKFPTYVLDLCVEFKNFTSGLTLPQGKGLLGALAYYGIRGIDAYEKAELRELAMRGGTFSAIEKEALLEYCRTDVNALQQLLPAMAADINLGQGLLRGEFVKAVALMEIQGIPFDGTMLQRFRSHWEFIRKDLIQGFNEGIHPLFAPSGKIIQGPFEDFIARLRIKWPRTATGKLKTDKQTLKGMANHSEELNRLRETVSVLNSTVADRLGVGQDGRHRAELWPFSTSTSRNAPSTNAFVFGPAKFLRSLIKPDPGRAVAFLDYDQQEFLIAAALSHDEKMLEAYQSGDAYLAFGKQAGVIPAEATRQTHGPIRNIYKAAALGVQYGIGLQAMSLQIGQMSDARQALGHHRKIYHQYWSWYNTILSHAMLHGKLETCFGWYRHVEPNPNPRSLGNFLIQATGAEILRIATILCAGEGINLCCTVHDAILIEGPAAEIESLATRSKALMTKASAIVLDGPECGVGVEIVKYPDRYQDERGYQVWKQVVALVERYENINEVAQVEQAL